MVIFSEKIRERRKELKMSQGKLGKEIGVTQAAISHLESGATKSLDAQVAHRLSLVLKMPQHEICVFDDEDTVEESVGYGIHLPLDQETYRKLRKAFVDAHNAINITKADGVLLPTNKKEIDVLLNVYLTCIFQQFDFDTIEVKRKLMLLSNITD